MDEPVQVNFELRPEDYRAWWSYSMQKRSSYGHPYWFGVLGLFVMLGVASKVGVGMATTIALCIAGLGIGYYGMLVLPRLIALGMASDVFRTRKAETQLGAHTLTVDRNGVHEKAPHGSHSHSWSAIEDLCHTSTHFFIVVAGLQAYVIPRRAFSSDASAQAFWSGVQTMRPSP
jgi:hypothetical protein